MIEKLERSERIKELSPAETLKKIGLKENDVFCDIGAGTGIFSFPAAKITKTNVYALDINNKMLDFINEKAKRENINDIITVKVDSSKFNVESNSCDVVFLCTVLHEIEDKEALLGEIERILKPNSRIGIIEFYKQETSFGPPVEIRISPEEMDAILNKSGFNKNKFFEVSGNFYCKVYSK